jgi:predicted metal-dependent HD superfamily phosphohydrolase
MQPEGRMADPFVLGRRGRAMNSAFLLEHWQTLFVGLELAAPPRREFDRLMQRYEEPHRAYHTVQHLEECFREFDAVRGLAQSPGAVAIALFFHDAIYDTHARDNEERSAELARRTLAALGAEAALLRYVADLILVTRHAARPETPDQKLVVDIDLSILGAPEARFDEYEQQVRQEYSWVDDAIFRSVRRTILEEFLVRPAIYSTQPFRDRLEHTARENLKRSIAALST